MFHVILLRRIVTTILILSLLMISVPSAKTQHITLFDGDDAYEYLTTQCDFGTRPPGSNNLSLCREYIVDSLIEFGWEVVLQNFTYLDVDCANIVAYVGDTHSAPLILGAHYDTRPLADHDPSSENRSYPVLGANDGASGVAVLLELANILPEPVRSSIELVFFDAEDSGNINGWNWIVGSTHYVDELSLGRIASIRAMVLLDMVGDTNLRLPREISSTDALQDEVWQIAAGLGYSDVFLNETGSSILDDHRPFLDAGIPALDIIHTPFPWYWHTREDTPDKCSAESLEIVGQVIETFIVDQSTVTTPFTADPPIVLYISIIIGIIAIVVVIIARYRYRT